MQDFPGNSQKAKTRPEASIPEAGPKIERVTSGEAVRRKRGLGRTFKETFVGGSARMAVDYMVVEVIVPAVRDTMAEALQSGIERLIYGDSRPRSRSGTSAYSSVGRFNYQGISSNKPQTQPSPPRPTISRRSRSIHDFGEIAINSRQEASEVLDHMFEILSRYGSVSVANLYELTDIVSSHVDHKFGWTSLQGAKVVRMRDGRFLLDLPEPESLN